MTHPKPERTIEIADEQSAWDVDPEPLRRAVELVLEGASVRRAEVSVALVDDEAMREMNRRYLEHDYATDVLSFVLERSADRVDGQIVVSVDTARAEAAGWGWTPADELLLYVIHGALHLVGHDDAKADEREAMRRREKEVLAQFGLEPRWKQAAPSGRRDREERES
ncbi:MAG TPA: rRNA maturation RNase YbeY [Planctomycetaceae bacterium]|nr:rRNA maturation RNase YbeY [Planctomycetaceae bacterium]